MRRPNQIRGFTLIELAIVLTVAGLLFVGLWRLLSGGNQQVRDQNAASQQQQLISAVKGYLASTAGQVFLSNIAASTAVGLPLPTVNNAPGACTIANAATAPPTNVAAFCNYLPPGFIYTAPNSYGQTFSIQVLKDSTIAGTLPNTYSFMITTIGGDTIPDTSGGRVSGYIGGDGGFIYTGAVCTAAASAQAACGAYGTWSVANITLAGAAGGYGFAASASGHIASRTYVSPSADNTLPWLERDLTLPDTNYHWNTMITDLYMGGQTQQPLGAPTAGNIYLYPPAGSISIVAANAGSIYMNGPGGAGTPGSIYLAGPGVTAGGGTINLEGGLITGTGTSNITLNNSSGGNALISASNAGTPTCPMTQPGIPATCPYAINTDSITVSNLVNANAFYAQSFVYTASDQRLKYNIHPIADSLADIMKLKPVSFTFRASGKEGLGVVAQDLEKVYPQLVTPGDGAKFVNYEGLIGPLIGAVQELQQENGQLREQIRAQEKRQEKLEREIRRDKNS